jgi:hypothetical protein
VLFGGQYLRDETSGVNGTQVQLHMLSCGLAKRGHDIHCIATMRAVDICRRIKWHRSEFGKPDYGIDFKSSNGARGFGVWVSTLPHDILEDVDVWDPRLERQKAGIFQVSQAVNNIGICRRIKIHGTLTAIDIGGVVIEERDIDGRALGIQNADDFHWDFVFARRTGPDVVPYRRDNTQLPTRTMNRIAVGGMDISEHSAFYEDGGGSNSAGLMLATDNNATLEGSKWKFAHISGIKIRGYDTDPTRAFLHCIRSQLEHESEIWGVDLALSDGATIATSRSATAHGGTVTGTYNIKSSLGKRGRVEKGDDGLCVGIDLARRPAVSDPAPTLAGTSSMRMSTMWQACRIKFSARRKDCRPPRNSSRMGSIARTFTPAGGPGSLLPNRMVVCRSSS